MSDYYDVLRVSPQASSAEIQAAIDVMYNQWRQSATHPNPDKRAEAEQAKRALQNWSNRLNHSKPGSHKSKVR